MNSNSRGIAEIERAAAECRKWRTLTEVLADPEALRAPTAVIPRTAWRQRVTLLAAREKDGKSTYAQAGAAAVSKGRKFLDETAALNRVLFLSLEEHIADVASKFVDFKSDPDRICILERLDLDPFAEIIAAIEDVQPSIVIVDTLAEFVKSMGLEGGSSKDWQPVMSKFTRIARDMDTGLLLLHHARKSDGKYRDSTAIGAGVDVVIEMQPGLESSIRKMNVRARWAVGNYAVRLAGNPDDSVDAWRYELADGEPSLDARIILHIGHNPGCTMRKLREGVSGRTKDIEATLKRLVRTGEVDNRGSETSFRLHLNGGSGGSQPGTTPVPPKTLMEQGRNQSPEPGGSRSQTLGTGDREPLDTVPWDSHS